MVDQELQIESNENRQMKRMIRMGERERERIIK
jgi:hypothetical protein